MTPLETATAIYELIMLSDDAHNKPPDTLIPLISNAIWAEREACAKVVEQFHIDMQFEDDDLGCKLIAADIRNRDTLDAHHL